MGTAGVELAVKPELWFPSLEELDIEELQRLGLVLDKRPLSLGGRTVAEELAARMLQVRTRGGITRPLVANAVQELFERSGDSEILC